VACDPLLTKRARLALLAGYAGATFLSFPHPLGERVIDLGLIFGWLSPALLIVGVRGLAPGQAAKTAFVAGVCAHAALMHWLYIVSVVYGHAAPPLGLLAPIGGGIHAGVYVAMFAAAWVWLDRRGLASPWSAAVLWVAFEHFRTEGPLGFPWGTLGYSQHDNPVLLAWVAYTGVYGMSFALALGGAGLAQAATDLRIRGKMTTGSWVAFAGVAAIFAIGVSLPSRSPEQGADTIRTAVVQGNIEQGVKWDEGWMERTLVIYEDLSREAARAGAELIVFPESAIPGALNSDVVLRSRLAALARETGVAFAIGSVAVEIRPGHPMPAFFDSAFLLEPNGRFGDRYDKSRLVPFGEYVPLRDWLGALFEAIARGMATFGLTPGPGPRAMKLSTPAVEAGQLTVGVPICYELLFPELTRRFVRDGAEMLLAITNDAWYGRTGAPHQFLAMTAVRSAENEVWTARAANTGVSAIIDSRGRVRLQTRIFERGFLVADVPLRPSPLGGTFYSRHGDLFVYLCWAGVAGLALAGLIRKKRELTQ
jgi:apolipoprotein N-acyltransferase